MKSLDDRLISPWTSKILLRRPRWWRVPEMWAPKIAFGSATPIGSL
jgi:hypothetical protein